MTSNQIALLAALPPNEHAPALVTPGLWLFVPWARWVDRHRELVA